MAAYDLQLELRETILRLRMLADVCADDPELLRGIHDLLAELAEELSGTDYPLAPRHPDAP
jgi:hypothetical protein